MTGKKLKEKLVQAGITQKELANRLNVTPQSVTAVINANDVKSGTLERIAEVLGVGMDFFYPTTSGQTNVNNFGKQHAKYISNGGDNIANESGSGNDTIALLVQQNAELIALLKAKEGL